jgi:hypothetical protein
LVHKKKVGAVRWHLGNYLNQKAGVNTIGLDHVENLMVGLNEELALMCEQLVFNDRKMEAKGVFDRNKLTVKDFEFKGGKNKKPLANELKNMKYDEDRDY